MDGASPGTGDANLRADFASPFASPINPLKNNENDGGDGGDAKSGTFRKGGNNRWSGEL